MRLNAINTLFAIAISALLSYGCYSLCIHGQKEIVAVGTFILLAVITIVNFALTLPEKRTTTLIHIVASIFLTVVVVLSVIFSLIYVSTPAYIITNGLTLIIFLMVVLGLAREKQ